MEGGELREVAARLSVCQWAQAGTRPAGPKILVTK